MGVTTNNVKPLRSQDPAQEAEIMTMMDASEATIKRTGFAASDAKKEYDVEVVVARQSLVAFMASLPA